MIQRTMFLLLLFSSAMTKSTAQTQAPIKCRAEFVHLVHGSAAAPFVAVRL
jgi:hypothetical protein